VLAVGGSWPVDSAVFVDLLALAVAGRCVPGRRDPATPATCGVFVFEKMFFSFFCSFVFFLSFCL
jgi:hypothetical protein